MTSVSAKQNLLGMSQPQLQAYLGTLGEKPYRSKQIMKWIYHRDISNFDDMSDISKPLRAKLNEIAEVREPEILSERISTDGTRKWLMKSESGSAVETVFIPEGDRGTLCVSSQVGCALDCSFCSTGKQGFNSDLTAAEIIGQVRQVNRVLRDVGEDKPRQVTNVVMMGMGEPLLNLDSVMPAIHLMMDDMGYGISKRKVTVSTSGVVPGIERLKETTDCSLAISLHAPNDELRNQLVPINKKYPIAVLLAACKSYAENFGEKRTVTVEYTLMDKVNDQPEHAAELVELLKDFPCKINLIPFNPFPGSGYKRPSHIAVRAFQERLMKADFNVMVRTTRGDDIDAACGQLVGAVQDKTRRQEKYRKIAIGVAS